MKLKKPLRLIPTNLPNHFTFEPPPVGLKLETASDQLLREHGIPHRPDPKKHPHGSRLWLRAMRSIKKFVTPELVLRRSRVHGNNVVIQNGNSNIWSGLVASTQAPYISVFGNWIVPSATVPPGGADAYNSSLWVGLNGQSLLQAGTEQDSTLNTGFFGGLSSSYYAWFEWFPAPSVQISNFPVNAGDAMVVNIEPLDDGSGGGSVSLSNLSTGIATTIAVPIPTTDFNGNPISPAITGVPSDEAVWILERPSSVVNQQPVPDALADFGEAVLATGGATFLVGAGAGKTNTVSLTVGENDGGTLLNMIANDGVTVLATATEEPGLVWTFTGGPSA